MSDLAARIASLPPEKRALLERRLLSVRARVAAAPSEISRRPAGPAPLSFAQRRLWFLDQLDPGSSLYNVPEAFVVRGPLDVRALEQALREVVRRHEVLRTGFGGDNGKPSARVADAFPPLAVTDLSTTPPSEREAKARLLAEAEASEPFDLGRPPLLRARVLRLDPEEHWLLLTMHHIVSDDWSMGVLYRELEELYGAFRSGRAPALPDLPIQYADYAAWQARWLTGDTLAAQLSYWKESLSGELPALDLPTDRPRPPSPSYRGADVRRVLPPRLSERVEALSRRENATLFMTLLAAFQVLLSRYCGQTDIPVGTPIAGRHRRETEDLIGFFVNTLVLRADLSDDPAFETLLRRTRDGALGAYAHQDLPFEKLVEELRPERSLSRTPLFQVMFELDNAPGEPLALPGVDVAPMELPDSSAKFDLRLLAIGEGDRLELVFEYATDLFDAATIERMAATFERLLEGVVADPAQAVSRLPLLSDREARTLLVDWNATTRDFPRDRTLHGLVADQVRRTPEAVAVEHGDDAVTYRELGRRARALAARLRRMGAGPGTIVGISLERSVNLVVGLLGILESGAAYLPLDPNYPDKRLEFMRSDAGIRILVTETALRGALPSGEGLEVVCLDEEDAEPFGPAPDAAGGAAFPESPAYVLYTSGSTGTPKGVVIPHRAIVNHMAWMLREFPLDAPDAVVQKTPLSFDASVWEFWAPLLSGARLVMAGREGHHDTADLIATIRQHGVTVLQVVPSLLTMLLEDPGFRECRSLQRVFCGGAPLARDVARRFFETLPAELVNLYGPTETTIDATFWVCRREDGERPIPIGRPVSNTRVYVTDPRGQLVPIGAAGELRIGGEGLALGYLGRADLTAEKFVADPFRHGARVYRTGDRVRWRSDGTVEFAGRFDDQVKIRGLRIEPGEIETALRACAGVREAVVIVREDQTGDRRLVAYFVARPGSAPSPGELQRELADRLPDYMVPTAFVPLPELPRLPNGKVDRASLPAPDRNRRQLSVEYAEPEDALELQLSNVWESVLGSGPVGRDDNFFDLGGHSLLAVRLFAEIEKATGHRLPLSALFQAPTVRQIAELIRERGGELRWSLLVPIQASGSRPPFFCVHAAGGGVMPYRALAQRLGPDQPFFGLQARAFVEGPAGPTRVEDMAETYLEEIRSRQPAGPYYIGGHSAGGTVAYEMACRLAQRGERVALLALFDTWGPGHGDLIPEKLLRLLLAETWQRLGRLYRGVRDGARFAYLREKLAIRARVLLGRASEVPRELREVRSAIEQAAIDYRPGSRYPGVLTLFRARRQPAEYALDRTLGWSTYAGGGVEVHTVPGYHGEIVDEPQAAILAEKLHECLDRAIAAERPLESAGGPGT